MAAFVSMSHRHGPFGPHHRDGSPPNWPPPHGYHHHRHGSPGRRSPSPPPIPPHVGYEPNAPERNPGRPYPGGSGPFYPTYPGGPGGSYPGGPGSPGMGPYPPFRPDFERGRHHERGSHYGPGPHGPGLCPPQCGYGWFPPAHCVGSYSWCEASNGSVPHNAVKVGVDKDGGHIYAGRAFYEGDLLPAKVIPSHGCAFVAWGGREHTKYEYEVLCSVHVGWTTCSGGDLPPEAIAVGQTTSGERLYMGRVMHEGTLTPGKIQPSHGVLYIPYNGLEISYTQYEAMVLM